MSSPTMKAVVNPYRSSRTMPSPTMLAAIAHHIRINPEDEDKLRNMQFDEAYEKRYIANTGYEPSDASFHLFVWAYMVDLPAEATEETVIEHPDVFPEFFLEQSTGDDSEDSFNYSRLCELRGYGDSDHEAEKQEKVYRDTGGYHPSPPSTSDDAGFNDFEKPTDTRAADIIDNKMSH
jgi:hypothetical protein